VGTQKVTDKKILEQKNRKVILKLLGVILGMTEFAFALVPLYNIFCDVTGINGKTGSQVIADVDMQEITSREISLEFIATRAKDEGLKFRPKDRRMELHPGKMYSTEFYVKNETSKAVVLQAVPSISPGRAAQNLHKTECF